MMERFVRFSVSGLRLYLPSFVICFIEQRRRISLVVWIKQMAGNDGRFVL